MSTESKYPASSPTPEGYGQPAGIPAPPAPYGSQWHQQPPAYVGYSQQQTAPMNTLALISFIGAFFVSLLGVILGHVALSQISRTGERGRGLAIAGLVLGYVGCAFGVIVFIVLFSYYGLNL